MSEPDASPRATPPAPGRRGRFTPWGLLARTLVVWLRNAPTFTVVSIVAQLPLAALELRAGDRRDLAVLGPLFLLSWFLSQSANAALCMGVLQSLGGGRAGPLALLAATARQLWPIFVVAGVWLALVLAGLFAMIVPGVFALVAGSLAIPALLAEPELGAGGALRRSLTLTQGHRLTMAAAIAILMSLELLAVMGTDLALPATLAAASPGRIVVASLVGAVVGGFTGCCPAVAYHDLRVRGGEGAPRVRSLGQR